jgi:hypothetical protein
LRPLLYGSALLLSALAAFVCGVLVGRFKYPPFQLAERVHERFIKSEARKEQERQAEARFLEPSPDYYLNDIPSLISIRTGSDVEAKRARLVEVIWRGRPYPRERMPDAVERDVRDEAFAGVANLGAIDRFVVETDYGINSVGYHFRPLSSNNRLVIYHAGHAEDLAAVRRQIAFFVGRGYAVVALAMPLEGANSRPVVEIAGVGRMRLKSHAQLAYLDAPLRFFAEPVVVALNYAERHYRYDSVAMAGLSGGGWTTTLCAALDTRIARSYPVAGSVPEVLRGRWLDWGDFEQQSPELARAANALELYVLGAHGPGRRQMQVLNQFDNCCFYGLRHPFYEPHVRDRLAALGGGGDFSVLLDTTHRQHMLSDFALAEIARDLERDEVRAAAR